MIRAGVLGATGYAGFETVRLLTAHPMVKITYLASKTYAGKKIYEVYPNFKNVLDLTLSEIDIEKIKKECDIVFTALPHGASKEVIPTLYKENVKVIDLSGDFRYNDEKVYEQWYGQPHKAPNLLKKSVYGLCELHRKDIKNAPIIGNPGCYTTCSIMPLAPLVANKIVDTKNIIIDANSGVTGAGRTTGLDYSFCECTENMKAYKIATHRHTSEIEQELSILAGEKIMVSFTPHLVPLKRGILATAYANLKKCYTEEDILKLYNDFYKNEYFVRILKDSLPQTKNVAGSNFIEIGFKIDKRLNRIVTVSAIDNLFKGAAGQAIQNMNIVFGLDEKTGIGNGGFYL